MAPFYGWFSTASKLKPHWGGSLLYNKKFPEIPGIHLSTSKEWKVESTLDPPNGFKQGTPGFGI